MILKIGKRRFEIADFAAASAKYQEIRDASGKGASDFPEGTVVDYAEKFVARVSYNGRVWAEPK